MNAVACSLVSKKYFAGRIGNTRIDRYVDYEEWSGVKSGHIFDQILESSFMN
jgi:hypothetical protein